MFVPNGGNLVYIADSQRPQEKCSCRWFLGRSFVFEGSGGGGGGGAIFAQISLPNELYLGDWRHVGTL